MEIQFKHITEVTPEEITLKKDGTILLNKQGYKKRVIGSWSVSYPKREAKAKGLRQSDYVERFYEGGIPYKGTTTEYERKDFLQSICALIAHKGIDIKI